MPNAWFYLLNNLYQRELTRREYEKIIREDPAAVAEKGIFKCPSCSKFWLGKDLQTCPKCGLKFQIPSSQTAEAEKPSNASDEKIIIKPDSSFETIIQGLNSNDTSVRYAAVNVLGKMQSEITVEPLIRALNDEDMAVRMNAADCLCKKKSEKSVEPLIQLALKDSEEWVRQNATEALFEIKSERAVDLLIQALEESGWAEVQCHAADALGIIKSEKAIVPLIRAIQNGEETQDVKTDVSLWASIALGHIKSDKSVDLLIPLLTSENKVCQNGAARALRNIGSEKAINTLLQALTSKNAYAQFYAAHVLSDTNPEKTIDLLIQLLNNGEICCLAAFTLGCIGSDKAVEPLIQILKEHGDPDLRYSATSALGAAANVKKSEKALNALSTLALNDEDMDVRQCAQKTLSIIQANKKCR